MAFADLMDVEDLLDFELDEQAQRQCVAKLQQASIMARHYARPLGLKWPESHCPDIVKVIVINVVERYMRNPDHYQQSRAADETLVWKGDAATPFEFSKEEKEILAAIGAPGTGLYSVQTYHTSNDPRPNDGWVPTTSGNEFPIYAAKDSWLWDVLP